jgi:hypothetical protein
VRQRHRAWHAGGREGFERRRRALVRAEGLHRRKLGLRRRAALDGVAQSLGCGHQTRHPIVGAGSFACQVVGEGLDCAVEGRDTVGQCIKIASRDAGLCGGLGRIGGIGCGLGLRQRILRRRCDLLDAVTESGQ